MTVDTTAGGELAGYDAGAYGLEDFDTTDAIIPRLSIAHESGQWKDNLTGQTYPALDMIMLGLVKQRVLFHNVVEDNDVPMCKSSNFTQGYVNTEAPPKKSFPWEKSGFNPADYPADSNGSVVLPCEGCALKDWGSHPNGNTPYCTEQYTIPIYFSEPDAHAWAPAIMTLQRSSVKPIRSYFTKFKRSQQPAFTAVCQATLDVNTRGTVTYSVPAFRHLGESDRNQWGQWAKDFIQMRQYLQQAPVVDIDAPAATAPPAPAATAPPAPAATAPPAPAAAAPPAPAATAPPAPAAAAPPSEEDDLPF